MSSLRMTVWPSMVCACGPRQRTFALCAALCAAALAPGLLSPAGAAASGVVPANVPLPASNYVVEPLCAPPAPGHVSCFSLRVVPVTAVARAHTHPMGLTTRHAITASSPAEGAFGLRPQDLHGGYALPTRASSTQTIAIVDAYDDPTAESDLKSYDTEFHLPECTKANGCFKKVNQAGTGGEYPEANSEWDGEISLDIETAHAICQENCHIILVEAERPTFADLTAAEETAVRLGATEVSNSWGGGETSVDSPAFEHPGVVITASTGDDGYLNWLVESPGHPNYPASSPHVVAVGGTRLKLKEESGETKWSSETVWNDGGSNGGNGAGGSGCSKHFEAPPWQQAVPDWSEVGCPENKRAAADVAADADPFTGVAIIDNGHWGQVGGTSLASPIIAATFALAGGSGGVSYPAQTLYSHLGESSSLHDVVSGSNGRCTKPYDFETGTSGCTMQEESEQCNEALICTGRSGLRRPLGRGNTKWSRRVHPAAPDRHERLTARREHRRRHDRQGERCEPLGRQRG